MLLRVDVHVHVIVIFLPQSDALSQILRELHELKRSYSALAGSLLVVRRNQEDIKTRLMEIGISVGIAPHIMSS